MAVFQCLLSGQTVEFIHQVDIDSMKGHPDYIRLDDETSKPTQTEQEHTEAAIEAVASKKPMGRPRKVVTSLEA